MTMRNLFVVGVAALAVSCSSSARSSARPAPLDSARARTTAACVIVQLPDAAALFGRPATRVAVSNVAGSQSVCGFAASTTNNTLDFTAISYSLNVYVYDGTTHFEPRTAKNAVMLAGVGERAFRSAGKDQLVVEFVKHNQTVLLAYSITAIGKHPSPATATNQLVELARTVAARM